MKRFILSAASLANIKRLDKIAESGTPEQRVAADAAILALLALRDTVNRPGEPGLVAGRMERIQMRLEQFKLNHPSFASPQPILRNKIERNEPK